jgi:hypothetical protein
MCTQYLHRIHPPCPSPTSSSLPLMPTPQGRTCSTSCSTVSYKEKIICYMLFWIIMMSNSLLKVILRLLLQWLFKNTVSHYVLDLLNVLYITIWHYYNFYSWNF